ncbi:MAG: PAS domain S-box protein, partial [Pseudomonadota bacterium]
MEKRPTYEELQQRLNRLEKELKKEILERGRVEEMLRKGEEKLRTVIEHSNEIFYIHDIRHVLSYVSPASEEILGYTSGEAMRKWTDLATDNPINLKGIEITEKAISTGERQGPYHLELRKKDGTIVLLEIDESPIKDEKGRVVGIAGAARDVTERTRAEKLLRESAERFRAIFEQAALGVAQVETETGRFLRVNQKYCDIVGYTQEDMVGTTFMEITHPDDLQRNLDSFEKFVNGEIQEYTLDKRYVRKDGSIVWVNITVSPMAEVPKKPGYLISVVQDITDRKRAEEALHEQAQILASIKDTIVIITPEMKTIYANQTARDLFGDRPEMFTEPCYRFFKKRETVCENCPVLRAFKDQMQHQAIMKSYEKNGKEMWRFNTAFPFYDRDGRLIAAIE